MPSPVTNTNNAESIKGRTHDNTYAVDKGLLCFEVPPVPDGLNAEGALWWGYYCELMIRGKVLSQMFLTSITNLCMQHMIRSYLWGQLQGQGITLQEDILDRNGYAIGKKCKTNPALDDYQRCITLMDKLLISLGMTAYSAKVNNIDTSGGIKQAQAAAPPPAPKLFQSEVG